MSVILWLLCTLAVAALTAGAWQRAQNRRSHPAPRELVRRALVVLPADDDQRAQLQAISTVVDADPRVDVLVVEPSAGMPTVVDEVSPRIFVLRHPGLTTDAEALRLGAVHALTKGYDAVIELSVRHSALARRLTSLLDALDDGAHVAIGSRYVPGGRVIRCSRTRRLASRAANVTLRCVTGTPVKDLTAHLRVYRREAVERALLAASGADRALGVDILVRCHDAGLQIVEVPVTVAGPQCSAVRPSAGRDMLSLAVTSRLPGRASETSREIDLVGPATAPAGR